MESESISTALTALAELAEVHPSSARHLCERRQEAGDISLQINAAECLVITRIDAMNLDPSIAAEVTIRKASVAAELAIPIDVINGAPVLLIFGKGSAQFTFTGIGLAGQTAHFVVSGFRIPAGSQKKLSVIATRFGVTS